MKANPWKRAVCLFAFTCLLGIFSSAQAWVFLGERKVSNSLDHDTIRVTGSKGTFRNIKLVVRDTAINLYRLIVTFGDGSRRDVTVRSFIEKNGETRVIDLPGNKRVIQRVDFWYEAKSIIGHLGSLRLWGKT